LSINLGSLGFLCPFDFENYPTYVDSVIKGIWRYFLYFRYFFEILKQQKKIQGNVPILLRNRLKCKFEPKTPHISNSSSVDLADSLLEHQTNALNTIDIKDMNSNNKSEWIALNEIVVDRGSTPYLSNLELYLNDYLITVVQGDGIIISTTTGSTAYAMAAGASMCRTIYFETNQLIAFR
jgi:NAD+ kinase